jgi:predicted nucleotidyltransferase
MIEFTTASLSNNLSFAEVIDLLKASPQVDGIATFGSHAVNQANPASDYDLLILVRGLPVAVFQMITTIDGRLADIVPVDVALADRLLVEGVAACQDRFDRLFVQKMCTAHILFDRTMRLTGIQRLSQAFQQANVQPPTLDPANAYSVWFWQGFGLLHLERMAASLDPIHQAAADMMLASCLVGTWRAYFEIRNMPWAGEKAALHYWLQHDAACYALVQDVLAASDRTVRLNTYKRFVSYVLEPIGASLQKGQTAVILNGSNSDNRVSAVVAYWNDLLEA